MSQPKSSFHFILFIFLLLFLASCASHRYTKKAVKFEEVGLYEDAAEYYYMAVNKKPGNVQAKLGLRKTGQQSLDKKLQDVKEAYKQSNFEDVVYYYLAAESYKEKMSEAGVNLNLPVSYESYYEEAKKYFLSRLYSQGLDKLVREEFTEAEKIFREILNVDEDYKDAYKKLIIAKYEPLYRSAGEYFDNQMFRKAYYAYDDILKGAGSYKQALSLKNEAREKGSIPILISGFGYAQQSYIPTAELITSGLKGQLIQTNNPFIKLIDEKGIRNRIYKNGKLDTKAAGLMGIKAVLNGKILSINKTPGKLIHETEKGYLKEYKIKVNSEGEKIKVPEYKKTEYTQYHRANAATLHVNFTLVLLENNEIIISELIKLDNKDEINYAKFNGDHDKLVPGYWRSRSSKSDKDVVKDNYGDVRALKKLLNANKNLKSVSTLLSELANESVSEIVSRIENYNPER